MTTRVLAAGDGFVRADLLAAEVRRHAPDELDVRELTLPWPTEPFGSVGGVDEASGTEDEVIAALDGATACVTQLAPITARVLDAAPDLRLVGVGRGGPVNVDVAAAAARDVAVCSVPGRNASATAEHTVALLLAALKAVPETDADLRRGVWRGDRYGWDEVGFELGEATVGLVGYGAVGRRVAAMVAGFGAEVVVHDPFLDAPEVDGHRVHAELADLLADVDVLSLHARATPATAGLIGAAQLRALRPGAVVVNCARGSLLDEDALCDALDDGHLLAAGLDVYATEPPPADARLLRTRGLVLTPHLAGASRRTARTAARVLGEEVGRFLRGEPLHHPVVPPAGS